MSLPAPAFPSPTQTRSANASAGRGRLALAQSRTARPVRLDLDGTAPPGPAGPLAPITPWGVDPSWNDAAPASGHARLTDLPLSDLVDRAAAQVVILRRVVDDAASADRTVRAHVGDLTQRLQQGQRFAVEFDARLAQAGRAAGMLEKVSQAIGTLQGVVEQIRTSHDALGRAWQSKLEAQRQETERRIADLERRFEDRLAELARRADETLALGEDRVNRARADAEAHAEHACAKIDRHAAQAQARVSLILDSASDRLSTMEAQVERLGGETTDAVEAMCQKAAALLGRDPRRPLEPCAEPAPGSLAAAVAAAEALIRQADETGLRVTAIRTTADAAVDRLASACTDAERVVAEQLPAIDGLRDAIASALADAERSRAALAEAVRAQADAAARSTEASSLLSRQREDLQAIAEATRYHVDQARTAETSLAATVEEAGVRGESLRRAMAEVAEQATAMVDLAKKVARLVEAAKPQSGPADTNG